MRFRSVVAKASSKGQKIGYLVPQFPGQTHIFFWRELAALERLGARVRLFSTRKPPPGLISHSWSTEAMERTTYLGEAGPIAGLRALPRMPYGQILKAIGSEPASFFRDLAVTIPAARALCDHCRADAIDHVHVHSCGRAALIAALARAMGGPTYSLTLHGELDAYGPGQRFKWQRASFATAVTRKLIADLRSAMPEVLPDTLLLQPMGVDIDALTRDRPYVPHTPGETLRLFCCARLNIIKGHVDLLQAVKQLLETGQPVALELAGEDDEGGAGYRRVIEHEIKRLDLQDHVTLLGAIDAETVRQKLLSAHIFVLASWMEALGVAYMEAMSCGVPVIGTDVGGVAELITSGQDGILVPPRDPSSLAAAIRSVAEDSDLSQRLGSAGRDRVVAGFSSARGAETLMQGLASLTGGSHDAI